MAKGQKLLYECTAGGGQRIKAFSKIIKSQFFPFSFKTLFLNRHKTHKLLLNNSAHDV